MRRVYVGILLFACFQSQGLAQQRMAKIPDVDARKVMEEMKRKDTAGMFRQNQAGKPAGPVVGSSGQPTTKAGNASDSRPVMTLPKPQVQAVPPASTPVVRSLPTVVGVPSPMRIYRRPSSSLPMVRYFAPEDPQPYVKQEPSLYLEDGSISRTFFRHIEHHPQMIEVKLQPNEALAFYSGDPEKIRFARIEDVPQDGILCSFGGSQVFLRFGSICGLDGNREVALAFKTGHQEVAIRRAKIVTLDANVKK